VRFFDGIHFTGGNKKEKLRARRRDHLNDNE
jgi:hypothetical protein